MESLRPRGGAKTNNRKQQQKSLNSRGQRVCEGKSRSYHPLDLSFYKDKNALKTGFHVIKADFKLTAQLKMALHI